MVHICCKAFLHSVYFDNNSSNSPFSGMFRSKWALSGYFTHSRLVSKTIMCSIGVFYRLLVFAILLFSHLDTQYILFQLILMPNQFHQSPIKEYYRSNFVNH